MDEEWSLTQKHYKGELDAFFLSQMRSYHANDKLPSYLCLVCHSGKNELVPDIHGYMNSINTWTIKGGKNDMLLLHQLELSSVRSKKSPYQKYITSFIQDPERSGSYAIGPDTYSRAALLFMRQLWLWEWPLHSLDTSLSEQDMSCRLICRNNIWELDASKLNQLDNGTRNSVTIFLTLGYITFFLRLCEESQFVTANDKTFSLGWS